MASIQCTRTDIGEYALLLTEHSSDWQRSSTMKAVYLTDYNNEMDKNVTLSYTWHFRNETMCPTL